MRPRRAIVTKPGAGGAHPLPSGHCMPSLHASQSGGGTAAGRRRIADLTSFAIESAPVTHAEIGPVELDLAAGAHALVVDQPVLPQDERPLPFQELKAVAPRLLHHLPQF